MLDGTAVQLQPVGLDVQELCSANLVTYAYCFELTAANAAAVLISRALSARAGHLLLVCIAHRDCNALASHQLHVTENLIVHSENQDHGMSGADVELTNY